MDTPIVSPWLIYFISQVNNILLILMIISVVAFVGSLISLINFICNDSGYEKRAGKRGLKVFVPILLLALPISVLVPSKSTLIQMLCASQATKQNIEKVIDLTTDIGEIIEKKTKSIHDELKQDVIDIIKETKQEVTQ